MTSLEEENETNLAVKSVKINDTSFTHFFFFGDFLSSFLA